MRRPIRPLLLLTAAAVGATCLTAGGVAAAASTGDHFTNLTATTSIVTGGTWTITGTVVDATDQPLADTTLWVGAKPRSLGCGPDLADPACTDLAGQYYQPTNSDGTFTIASPADLDTTVVLYLPDDTGQQVDPTTGQQFVIHTHNRYVWSGPSSATVAQNQVGSTPFLMPVENTHSKVRVATGAAAATPRTQVSSDGGAHWRTVATGTHAGALPVTFTGSQVSFAATKPGSYRVRVVDNGGTYEDSASSPVVSVKVTKHATPAWMHRTNRYRRSLSLGPVFDNPRYDAALAKHVHWMHVNNRLQHPEDPGTRAYTNAGNIAGQSSDLVAGASSARNAVDIWVGAPFHAACLLRSSWAVGGYASEKGWAGEWCRSGMQVLDLATGRNSPKPASLRRSVTFPSNAMPVPTSLLFNRGEIPDPLAHCGPGAAGGAWSVPVYFRVANPPAADRKLKDATAVLRTAGGTKITPSCFFTGSTFRGATTSDTQLGRAILGDTVDGRWAVLLVGSSLKPGHRYIATLHDHGYTQKTTFRIAKH